jgi:hypothetical protein
MLPREQNGEVKPQSNAGWQAVRARGLARMPPHECQQARTLACLPECNSRRHGAFGACCCCEAASLAPCASAHRTATLAGERLAATGRSAASSAPAAAATATRTGTPSSSYMMSTWAPPLSRLTRPAWGSHVGVCGVRVGRWVGGCVGGGHIAGQERESKCVARCTESQKPEVELPNAKVACTGEPAR